MGKILLLLLVLFLLPGVFCDSISDYTVSNQVPLNEKLTIYGKYSGGADVLCAFYLFDAENLDRNVAIIRLTDQYTFSDGSFYAEYKITEPLFIRGIDYNAITKCGTTETGALFEVAQKNDIVLGITSNSIMADLAFFTKFDNSMGAVLFLFAIIFITSAIVYAWENARH
jgi:hypothetical protein